MSLAFPDEPGFPDEGMPQGDGELSEDMVIPDDLSALFNGTGDLVGTDGLVVPDDISALTGAGGCELAVLITYIAKAEVLAAALAIAEIDAAAVPVADGAAVAVLHDLTGDAPVQAAVALSKLVPVAPMMLVTRSTGQLECQRYQAGVAGDSVPPGLVLAGVPEVVEDLLTGATTLDALSGTIEAKSLSKGKALRTLASIARKMRQQGGPPQPPTAI